MLNQHPSSHQYLSSVTAFETWYATLYPFEITSVNALEYKISQTLLKFYYHKSIY